MGCRLTDSSPPLDTKRGYQGEQCGTRRNEFVPKRQCRHLRRLATCRNSEQRREAWLHERRQIIHPLPGMLVAPAASIAHDGREVADFWLAHFLLQPCQGRNDRRSIVQGRPCHRHGAASCVTEIRPSRHNRRGSRAACRERRVTGIRWKCLHDSQEYPTATNQNAKRSARRFQLR